MRRLLPRVVLALSGLILLLLSACATVAGGVSKEAAATELAGNRFLFRFRSGLVVEAFFSAPNELIWKGIQGVTFEGANGRQSIADDGVIERLPP